MYLARCVHDRLEPVNLGHFTEQGIFIVCPGPSLPEPHRLRHLMEGVFTLGVTTVYPWFRPLIWVGIDTPDCYDGGIWSAPLIKVCRQGYENIRFAGRRLADWPLVFFAVFEKAGNAYSDALSFMDRDRALPWHRSSFHLAVGLAVKMGFRRIHFVGCDMGGAKDYCHDRVLKDYQRRENRLLYMEQSAWLREVALVLAKHGVTMISCTDGSPLNKFMDFKPLEVALRDEDRVTSELRKGWQVRDVREVPVPSTAGSYMPVLESLINLVGAKKVLEFGCVPYCTAFLLGKVDRVLTVADGRLPDAARLVEMYTGLKRWEHIQFPRDERFDLVVTSWKNWYGAGVYGWIKARLDWAATHADTVLIAGCPQDAGSVDLEPEAMKRDYGFDTFGPTDSAENRDWIGTRDPKVSEWLRECSRAEQHSHE